MYGGTHSFRARLKQFLAALFIFVTTCTNLGPIHTLFIPQAAEAAQVTIDPHAAAAGTSHLQSGNQTVFVNDQTGYKFFRDANSSCVYRKTTNGGTSWSATTTVDAQLDCVQITVWYDKWTPGGTGSFIHIATLDTSADDIFYNRLDTSDDTLLMGTGPVSMVSNSAQAGSIQEGVNFISITKATNGVIYAVTDDGTTGPDSYVVECSASCNLATSWIETDGATPLDNGGDYNLLVPIPGDDIMLINRDLSTNDMRSRIWDDSADTWGSWVRFDDSAEENTTYDVGMAVVVSTTTPGNIYLAYIASSTALGTNDEVRAARYNGTSWTLTTDVLTGTARGLTNVAIGLDAANDDVYVAYTGRTTAGTPTTGNVYWKWATSSMVNWSTESAVVNTGADDLYGLDINGVSDERIYASWFDVTDGDIYGDTLIDIFPGVHATTTGTQRTPMNAATTSEYIGGALVLWNTYRNASYDVTGITVTENGTIDGSTGLANVKLLYEMDTTAPYNCASVSYDGNEAQFGSTDTNGFSGADGVSSFTGSTVSLSTTTALCGYVVMDILDAALSSSTIQISINNPANDVTVTGATAGPSTAKDIPGQTFVYNDTPTLTHYHWRNDDNTEALATSKTSGVDDTALTALQQSTPVRLRLQVSNEGSTSTGQIQYRLEYGLIAGTCASTSVWTDVGATGGEFDMYNSSNLTDGANTTNIAEATGGVADENFTFLSTNGGVKDTSSQTGSINLTPANFVEFEYSIVASTTATEGNTYCFRLTNAGTALASYLEFPRANIAADVLVSVAASSQVSSTAIPATNFYVGSNFVVTDNTGSHTVATVTISEIGTVDAQNDLDNIRLYYDLDITNPYDCAGESYVGGEAQFGTTDTDGFSSANGTSTFTGSVNINTTTSLCLYTVVDTTSSAQNGKIIDIVMENPSVNLVLSGGGSVSPSITRDMNGSTTLVGPVLTQTHYHWRRDNGSEAAATSLTGGNEDTAISNVAQTTPVRLRMQISNEGGITSTSRAYILEYGPKISTCAAVSNWTDVGAAGGAFDMYNSTNLTDGANTTNIAVAAGGVTNENTTFIVANAAVKDTSSLIASTTISSTEYLEAEFSIIQTADAGYNTTYCFRLDGSNTALDSYLRYPELTTAQERDFEIQRGTTTVTGTSVTLTAGVDYTAPSASTSAFFRITNSNITGAGDNVGGGTQNADDVTVYVRDASNIMNSIVLQRPGTALSDTYVAWEIIEFIGEPGSDNEMVVRAQTSLTYGATSLIATGTAITGTTSDEDIVVFITGQLNPNAGTSNYTAGQSTSEWASSTNEAVFRRLSANSVASIVSYAVVEFKGINWVIQRNEHTFTEAGTAQTEPINSVGDVNRTFLHTQKRVTSAATGTDEFGHTVWLSSVGFISYFLETGAATTSQISVAWVIENIQTTSGAMVVTRSSGTSNGGVEPLVVSVEIETGKTLDDITNASIFMNSRSAGTGELYPRPIAGAIIASTTHYEIWRSDTGANLTYRTEIVEWPTAGLALKQNYYQFYVDNNALDPTDEWPPGGAALGENTVLSAADEPLGEGEHLRIRMSVKVINATLPTSTRAFKLQYAPMTTTCTAITESAWRTLGDSASSTIWRGYAATGTTDGTVLSTNPPAGGALNLSVSDVAGSLEEENNSAPNAYSVPDDRDIEYDWFVEQNGAVGEAYYCFRMVESDGSLLDGYLQYPQIRTASFTPRSQNWRWYDDENSATPTTDLEEENVAPINITNTQTIVLRVTVKDIKNISSEDVRFKLQYSEYADFSTSTDLVASTSCIATSTWCYAAGAGTDNEVIPSATLSDADSCVGGVGDGCGTYNESSRYLTGFRQESNAATEYSFTIQSAAPRVNRVYYFRLYDIGHDLPVTPNTGEAYPSLVTEGASLTFSILGVASTTAVEGVVTDITTTPNSVPYGRLTLNTDTEAAQQLQVTTNAPEGYQIYLTTSSDLLSSSGDVITPISGTNNTPSSWNTGCATTLTGCFGYHAGDDTLEGGSTRFAALDTYSRFSTTTLDEVVYYSAPVTGDTVNMVYRIKARELQGAGQYTTGVRYIAVPVF